MKPFKRKAGFLVFMLTVLLVTAGLASAADVRTVAIGAASGNVNAEVVLPITINDPASVGGIAFTIKYDPTVFQFKGIEQATNPSWLVKDPETYKVPSGSVQNDVLYYNPYTKADPYASANYTTTPNATLFFMYNDLKDGQSNPVGRVLVSGASAVPLTGTTLFQARFKIIGGGDTYPIQLIRSVINNAAAGYTTDTILPVLIGVGATDNTGKYTTTVFPEISAILANGSITVNAQTYSLGGKVTYGTSDGTLAIGSTVTLQKKNASNIFIYNDAAVVGADGRYAFNSKPAGDYKLAVHSNDTWYSDYVSPSAITLSANKTDADVVLPVKQQVTVSGTVTSGNIPGLQVQVVDGNGNVVGTYNIDPNTGAWTSSLLPAGTYNWFLVYGSLKSAQNATTFNTAQLKSISGTISGLSGSGGAVTVASVKGQLMKTMQVSNGAYTVVNLVAQDDYIVSAVGTGFAVKYYNDKTDVKDAAAVNISSANASAVDFSFVTPTSHITGKITQSGSNVVGKKVYGFEINSYALVSAVTDNSGNFDLSVQPGSYEVFFISDSGKIFYFYNEVGTATQIESSATLRIVTATGQTIANTNIDVTECDKSLSGKVTFRTAGGDPASNVLISVYTALRRAIGLTGQDGRYAIGGLCIEPEPYTVEMKPLSGSYPVQTSSIVAGTDTTKDFVIGTGAVLSGVVTEKNSNPVTKVVGAMLYLKDQTTGALVGGRVYFTDANGAYTISDIESGSYTLEVTHPDYQSASVSQVISGVDVTLNVELDKGAFFKGTVTDSVTTKPISGATIIIVPSTGSPIYAVTNASGYYSVYGLDATKSDYIIFASKRGYERQSKTGQQPVSGGTTANFALAPPTTYYKVSGTVKTDAVTNPEISGATVLVTSATKNYFASTTTNASGYYEITNLVPAADYKIYVIPTGNLPIQSDNFIIVAADKTENFTISLGKKIGGTVTGSVAIPSGTKVYVFLFKGVVYQGYTTAGTNGSFLFSGLTAANDYKLLVVAAGYTSQWYSGKSSIATADAVNVLIADKMDANITLVKP